MSDTAIAFDPDLPKAHAARAFALCRLQHFDAAKEAFGIALQLDASLYEAHFFYARMSYMRQ